MSPQFAGISFALARRLHFCAVAWCFGFYFASASLFSVGGDAPSGIVPGRFQCCALKTSLRAIA